jgi:hypothetical protein
MIQRTCTSSRIIIAEAIDKTPSRITKIIIFLVMLQIADGVLTALGLLKAGSITGGNLLLQTMMSYVGVVPTLMFVKALAVIALGFLFVVARKFHWIELALKGLAVVYTTAAIIPWTIILTTM